METWEKAMTKPKKSIKDPRVEQRILRTYESKVTRKNRWAYC